MLLYMGSSSALATHRREQQIRCLKECASLCGDASRRFVEQIASVGDRPLLERFTLGIDATRDCLTLCLLTASLLDRKSELSSFACVPCAQACRRCAEACDGLSPDDVVNACADRCRRAEQVCGERAAQRLA